MFGGAVCLDVYCGTSSTENCNKSTNPYNYQLFEFRDSTFIANVNKDKGSTLTSVGNDIIFHSLLEPIIYLNYTAPPDPRPQPSVSLTFINCRSISLPPRIGAINFRLDPASKYDFLIINDSDGRFYID